MRVRFVLSEILEGLRRNTAMTVSVVLVTFVSLVFVGAGALLQLQIGALKDYWYDKVEVSIFLCTAESETPTCTAGAVNDDQKDQIVEALESPTLAPYVQDFEFESQEQAFARFTEQFEGTSIGDAATADQLNESFRVKLVDPTQFQAVAQYFTGVDGVEEVLDQRRLLDRFFAVLNVFTAVSGGFAVVMTIAAALLIATTIRLSAFNRRRETGIMRLVGASKAVIQLPFLLEGVIAAVIGAALASAVLWAAVRFGVQGWLSTTLPLFSWIGTREVWLVTPGLFVAGILLAGISSLVTLSRHLKV